MNATKKKRNRVRKPFDPALATDESMVSLRDISELMRCSLGHLYNTWKRTLPPPAIDRPHFKRWRFGAIRHMIAGQEEAGTP